MNNSVIRISTEIIQSVASGSEYVRCDESVCRRRGTCVHTRGFTVPNSKCTNFAVQRPYNFVIVVLPSPDSRTVNPDGHGARRAVKSLLKFVVHIQFDIVVYRRIRDTQKVPLNILQCAVRCTVRRTMISFSETHRERHWLPNESLVARTYTEGDDVRQQQAMTTGVNHR